MEFTVSSAKLLKATMDVSKAVPSKTALPILENFLFDLKGSVLEITASDQELTLRTAIEVESVNAEGSMAVPAHQILDLLKVLPDQPISIRTLSDSNFDCVWANGNSSLPYFAAADFPGIKGAGEDAFVLTMTSEALSTGISSTVYATADDEMRPNMNGIFFDILEDSLTFVASDSHKLICYSAPDFKAEGESSFILHKKAANVLRGLLDKSEDEVTVSFDSSTAVFKFGSTMMVCRLIVGKYPKYRGVIPQNNSNILKIEREQLLNTVRRVSVCANKASNSIKLELKSGQMEITAQDLGFSLAAYEKIMCDYSGEELVIAFKSSFLIEMLSNMSCSNIIIKFGDSRRAALIVPSEEEADSERICGILMPVLAS